MYSKIVEVKKQKFGNGVADLIFRFYFLFMWFDWYLCHS